MTYRSKPSVLLALLCPLTVATTPPPPPAIAAQVREGRFDPGDYGWLQGMFDGASAAEAAAYASLVEWRRRCRISDLAETRNELAALGVAAGASLETIPYRSLLCDQVATQPDPIDVHDWTGFARDVALVRPLAESYLAAVTAAENAGRFDTAEPRDALTARPIGEQALRSGLEWANGSAVSGPSGASLTAQQRSILTSEIAIALAVRDHANTAWLKNIVIASGWPERSKVGEAAARSFWLLVQHADADPAFQVRALRAMEPLVEAGRVDRRRYARLYDRVMLKLTGWQRYATQLTCRQGRYVPQPLEAGDVDERRRRVDLDTMAEFQARVLRENGICT